MRRAVRYTQYCFFFNDTATTEIYTLTLHDALPISGHRERGHDEQQRQHAVVDHGRKCRDLSQSRATAPASSPLTRSEEHTSELQSRQYLVCRLLLEKKKCCTRYDDLIVMRSHRSDA